MPTVLIYILLLVPYGILFFDRKNALIVNSEGGFWWQKWDLIDTFGRLELKIIISKLKKTLCFGLNIIIIW